MIILNLHCWVSDNGQTKRPRGGFKKTRTEKSKEHKQHVVKASSPEPEENLCLLRATNGKKKLSTVVSAKEVTRFQLVSETVEGWVESLLSIG